MDEKADSSIAELAEEVRDAQKQYDDKRQAADYARSCETQALKRKCFENCGAGTIAKAHTAKASRTSPPNTASPWRSEMGEGAFELAVLWAVASSIGIVNPRLAFFFQATIAVSASLAFWMVR